METVIFALTAFNNEFLGGLCCDVDIIICMCYASNTKIRVVNISLFSVSVSSLPLISCTAR